MELGALIRRSWELTWRNRFLWILALFAPGFGGSYGGGSGMPGRTDELDFQNLPPEFQRSAENWTGWLGEHLGLILLAVGALLLLGFVLWIVSVIAQGGLARATVDLALGRPTGFGPAWRSGVGLFWRFLVLSLLGVALIFGYWVVLGLLGVVVATGLGPIGVALVALVAVPALLLFIPFAIAVGVLVAFAQRAIAIEELSVAAGLTSAWRILRGNLSRVAIVWLVSVALGIGIGIAMGIVAMALAMPLVGVAMAGFMQGRLTAELIMLGGLALAGLVLAMVAIGAVPSAFFWNYWSLAYLRISGRLESLGPDSV